jgi:hypothetical protein
MRHCSLRVLLVNVSRLISPRQNYVIGAKDALLPHVKTHSKFGCLTLIEAITKIRASLTRPRYSPDEILRLAVWQGFPNGDSLHQFSNAVLNRFSKLYATREESEDGSRGIDHRTR